MDRSILKIQNGSTKVLHSESGFENVIISGAAYSCNTDLADILLEWVTENNGWKLMMPLPAAMLINNDKKFDVIEAAKKFKIPFRGPFRELEIKLLSSFASEDSYVNICFEHN